MLPLLVQLGDSLCLFNCVITLLKAAEITITMYNDEGEGWFRTLLRRIRDNDPDITVLDDLLGYLAIPHMTDEDWEQLGRDISNNSYLKNVELYNEALNDRKMSFLFFGYFILKLLKIELQPLVSFLKFLIIFLEVMVFFSQVF